MTLYLLFCLFFILCTQPPTPLTFFPPIVNHNRKCLTYGTSLPLVTCTSLSSHRWLNTLKTSHSSVNPCVLQSVTVELLGEFCSFETILLQLDLCIHEDIPIINFWLKYVYSKKSYPKLILLDGIMMIPKCAKYRTTVHCLLLK
jgi:hypothetical protein